LNHGGILARVNLKLQILNGHMLLIASGQVKCYNSSMIEIKEIVHKIFTRHHIWITFCLVCFVGIIAGVVVFGEYRLADQKKQINLQTEKLASTTALLNLVTQGLQDQITGIVAQNNLLNSAVRDQINQTGDLLDQVEQVNDTAVALDKLSKVDTQLLQKYSKVFFLNENYAPANLATIPSGYVFDKSKEYQFNDKVVTYLEQMLDDARDDGVDLKVISAYRSFGTQAILKSSYAVIYGAGTANQFSADQGYSEHQLGTTVDFTTPVLGSNFDTFDTTTAYTWLSKNAYKYGFVISYPKSNTYYVYEPWHWRFVGIDLANRLHRDGEYFYDMDQRKINNYLGVFFD
jgi:zinc D-Ala-D-Ala carboxypeptidase